MSKPRGYISRAGHQTMLAELENLRRVQRPKIVQEVADAAAQGDRSENAEYIYGKKKLREIDRRCRFLSKRLERLEVVDADAPRGEKVFFGAWIVVEDEEEELGCYRIMGEDEVDTSRGYISYRSPMGRAALKQEADALLQIRSPPGLREYTLLLIHYGPEPPDTSEL